MKDLVFVSSVEKELAPERQAVCDFIRNDALLSKYFDVFLFEELLATDRRADKLYFDYVDRSAVYLGIFGSEYGWEDAEGVSPTEREFDRATEKGKNRLVYVKGSSDEGRHPKMVALIRKAERQLVRRRFRDIADLIGHVYASLIEHLEERGILTSRPLDAASSPNASLDEISPERVRWFLERARAQRDYAVDPSSSVLNALTHLNLLDGDRPANAAILLFGVNPQRRFPTAETKCLHFHGTEVRKPIPSYQLYKGDVFEQVDQAVDFVLSKLNRTVGTRDQGPAAPVAYEIPTDVVVEAVVNAIAHRDYASNAGTQVYLFADRVEVWNPGVLPAGLTPEKLRTEHPSIPRNPLLADALFLAHYIEKAGTGTLAMIDGCRQAGLPEPEFREDGDHFVLTLWRDWLTDAVMSELGLSEQQAEAVRFVRVNHRIANAEYREQFDVSKATATRDLEQLVKIGVFEKVGTTGVGTHYILAGKGLTKGSNDSSEGKGS
ncbi:DUF4062 domain-containing protein [Candidatus Bipolaricaulota bacterium]|nr:DUF4062 domain-containing protein [Candidatus Bipolaricaulota bacterium]MCK4598575.1 DUF4062 domain-containing protein [Candidatus Bipolaricaulota bacterium]